MARNMYGATSADFTITSGGRVIPGAVLTLWTARTGGTQITDLLDVDSVATTTVTSAADGSVVYYGPNNDKTVHWADSGQGSRMAIRPTDITGDPPVMSIGKSWVNAASPMPSTFPARRSRGVAALIMISMIRFAFSSTTPWAIHVP